ncbi:hypothetical protein [Paracoccus sp. SSK6]|uniref:hypothetical protein n=1 Tax=Paracoccus sp. SSK6 TaxID=3143131 RepID=UPI00321B2D14
MKSFLVAAAIPALGVGVGAAEAKPSSCSLVIAERDVFDGTCDFNSDPDGSFRLTYAGQNYFVYVNVVEPGSAKGYWNGWTQESRAHDDLGTLTREEKDPACWSNGYARVCAR